MRSAHALLLWLLNAVLPATTGCVQRETTQLEPLPSAGDENVARWRDENVRMAVRTAEWVDRPTIRRRVTPLWMRIENHGSTPVAIRYEPFVLETESGRLFDAIPPWPLRGDVAPARVSGDRKPVSTPELEHDRFLVAPFYSSVYPGLEAYDGHFEWDGAYYSAYYRYWGQVDGELPTRRMRTVALPEGVALPGGHVTGIVYFEYVRAEFEKVTLRTILRDPETGRVVARPSIRLLAEN